MFNILFQFTNPTICRNPVCNNRRRFMLDVDKSAFVDFQKIRIQEIQAELPHGSIPRSLEIILRAENVETVQVCCSICKNILFRGFLSITNLLLIKTVLELTLLFSS